MADEIICVGVACYDHMVVAESIGLGAPERERSELPALRVLHHGGGLAATAAATVSSLGMRSQLWARVGSDVSARPLLAELRALGVDTSQLVIVEGAETAISTVLVESDSGRRRVFLFPGRGLDKSAEAPDYQRIDRAAALLVEGGRPGVSAACARRAKVADVPVIAALPRGDDEERELASIADYVVATGRAASALAGFGDREPEPKEYEAWARKLLEGCPKAVIVTFGRKGLALWERTGRALAFGAFDVNRVDTTGAGGVMRGALAAGLAQGMGLEEALELASAAGALACTKLGELSSVPEKAAVLELLSSSNKPSWTEL